MLTALEIIYFELSRLGKVSKNYVNILIPNYSLLIYIYVYIYICIYVCVYIYKAKELFNCWQFLITILYFRTKLL